MIDKEFDFNDCPVGKLNNQEIKHTAENLSKDITMAMERIEAKVDSMNQKMDINFDSLSTKIDDLDDKVKSLEKQVKSLDKKLEGVDNIKEYVSKKVKEQIDFSQKDKVFNFFKWVIVILIGSTAVTVFGKYVLHLLNI